MASIIKRGDYQYQVTVRRKGYPKQCKTFESEREAKAWATVIESEIVRGVFTNRSELERITLGDLLSRYGEEVTPTKIGAYQEQNRIKRWKAHPLALRPLSTLRAADFSLYRDTRLNEVGPHSVRIELALVSAIFNYARKEWSIAVENPIKSIRAPSTPGGRERRLVGDEEERLLAAAAAARANPTQLKAAIQLAIETGLREGRLAQLRWDQIDFDKCVIWVMTKDEKHKQRSVPVPLTEKAVEVLKNLSQDTSEFVFGSAFSTEQTLGSAFRRTCERAKVKNLRFHDLRHEAASRFAPRMIHAHDQYYASAGRSTSVKFSKGAVPYC